MYQIANKRLIIIFCRFAILAHGELLDPVATYSTSQLPLLHFQVCLDVATTNIALGKFASMKSVYAAHNHAGVAVDGNTTAMAHSRNDIPIWFLRGSWSNCLHLQHQYPEQGRIL